MNINTVVLSGNLTGDPEAKEFDSGRNVTNFSVAVNRSWKNAQGDTVTSVDYFPCVAWNGKGKAIAMYLKKGSPVAIEGRLDTRTYEDVNGLSHKVVEILVANVQFLNKREGALGAADIGSEEEAPTEVPVTA